MTDVGSWSLKSQDDNAIPLKKMTLQADIKDLLMSWKVCQTFRNTTDKAIEATYTFPTAWSAVLTEFAVVIGDERLIAQAMPRSTAEEKYESAHEEGDLPILLNAADDGIASVTLGNLGPKEEVTLELTFLTLLAPVNGIIRITLPFSVGERYSADGRQGKLEPYEEIETSLTAEYPVQADFHITGALANCPVSVPSHPSSYSRNEDGIRIAVKKAFADRNLTLLFEEVPAINAAYLADDPFQDGGWVAACVFTPPASSVRKTLRVDILADCSGSMDGVGVVKMREALAALTEVLTKDDEITLTRFGSSIDPVVTSPRSFTSLFVRRSFQPAVSRIEADLGGTELDLALRYVFCNTPDSVNGDRQRIVLLITDGEIWHVEPMLEEVADRGVPIFVIGVGACAAEGHLQKIAAASGGLCEVVTHAEEMTLSMERLISSARGELLRFSFDEDWEHQCLGQQQWLKNGYCGTAASFFMRFDHRPAGLPVLHAASQKETFTLAAGNWIQVRDHEALAKATAYAEYAISADAEELAEKYGLLTAETSLLLVKEREDSQKQYSEDYVRVPQMADMQPCVDIPVFYRDSGISEVYHAMTPPSADALVKPLLNPFKIFSSKRSTPALAMEAIDCFNSLKDIPEPNSSLGWLDDYNEKYGFTAQVESWSTITKGNGNGPVAAEFWQSAATDLLSDTLDALEALVKDQYPQLSDDQCRLMVPVVMVLLVAEVCRRPVLHEPLIVAAQDLMFSMLGPDDGKWKQLKEPFCETYDEFHGIKLCSPKTDHIL